jgi:hypothetical protein
MASSKRLPLCECHTPLQSSTHLERTPPHPYSLQARVIGTGCSSHHASVRCTSIIPVQHYLAIPPTEIAPLVFSLSYT